MRGRLIVNCEQCVKFRQTWGCYKTCTMVVPQRHIERGGGIPDWCPLPKAGGKDA